MTGQHPFVQTTQLIQSQRLDFCLLRSGNAGLYDLLYQSNGIAPRLMGDGVIVAQFPIIAPLCMKGIAHSARHRTTNPSRTDTSKCLQTHKEQAQAAIKIKKAALRLPFLF